MSAGKQRPARFVLTFGLGIPADLEALGQTDPDALGAAEETSWTTWRTGGSEEGCWEQGTSAVT